MRVKTITVYERDLMFTIGGQLFDQSPNREPRKTEIIMGKVKIKFRESANNFNESYDLKIEESNLHDFIKELLMSIPEFVDLNLSYNEVSNNIKVDDENRGKYKFVSNYDKETSESWRGDFIDLDAFIGNVCCRLLHTISSDKDCFLCVNQNSIECDTCTINSKFKNNYKCSREPRGKYTFSCKFDCFYSRMICCAECDKMDVCSKKCESNSEICGNKAMK